ERHRGPVACEPRHATWFTEEADVLLRSFAVARVAADPARAPGADEPGGFPGLVYYRLHGSPKVYYSAYPDQYLKALAKTLVQAAKSADVWCIFDNTAAFAATGDALTTRSLIEARSRGNAGQGP
ncbi:MAG TPA: DUF72 domain-containing protein, partial [Microvirga sp.]|nr:DUF72 domain-containing protein [Microvirga sp.]